MSYEKKHTLLRDLSEGDVFLTKANTKIIYLKKLNDDKHLLKNIGTSNEYEVPHGNFPVFKKY